MDPADARNATKKAELEACVALADNFKSGDPKKVIAHWQIQICEEEEIACKMFMS